MLDPPRLDSNQRSDFGELREAIASSDRLRAERWLARRYRDPDFADDYFAAASDSFEDLGHNLIVAAAAWRLAGILGEKGRYAMLRVGVWEMVASGGTSEAGSGMTSPPDLDSLCFGLVSNIIENEGGIVSSHAIFLFDAALQTGDEVTISRVAEHLSATNVDPTPAGGSRLHEHPGLCSVPPEPPVYSFARDYGSCLKAHAVAKRLRPRFPNIDFGRMLVAVHHNLESVPSFEEMTFA